MFDMAPLLHIQVLLQFPAQIRKIKKDRYLCEAPPLARFRRSLAGA